MNGFFDQLLLSGSAMSAPSPSFASTFIFSGSSFSFRFSCHFLSNLISALYICLVIKPSLVERRNRSVQVLKVQLFKLSFWSSLFAICMNARDKFIHLLSLSLDH